MESKNLRKTYHIQLTSCKVCVCLSVVLVVEEKVEMQIEFREVIRDVLRFFSVGVIINTQSVVPYSRLADSYLIFLNAIICIMYMVKNPSRISFLMAATFGHLCLPNTSYLLRLKNREKVHEKGEKLLRSIPVVCLYLHFQRKEVKKGAKGVGLRHLQLQLIP